MSAVNAPYGLIPVYKLGGGYSTGATKKYLMPTNSTSGIFPGDLVNLNAGSVARSATSPTTTLQSYSPIGTMQGCKYIDANGLIQYTPYVPANAVTNGLTILQVYVFDDPDYVFKVQADGTVAASNIGLNAALNGFTAPTVTAGATPFSQVTLNSSTIGTTTTFAVRIIDVLTPTDAFSDVLVTWNNGVHRYRLSLAE
jgi:hypothetical protein